MSKVVAIRGTNASGKTWSARQIMRNFKDQYNGELKLASGLKYQSFGSFSVVGSYATPSGGADGCEYADVWPAIAELAQMGDVLVEGALICSVYQPWVDLMAANPQHEYTHICLNTSWEQIQLNMNNRRALVGKPPLEKWSNVEIGFNKNISSAKKLHAAGYNPHWVSADEAVEIAIKELTR